MNLSLLDPFRRQIPDRIETTITLPRHFHPRTRVATVENSSSNNNKSNDNTNKTKKQTKRGNKNESTNNANSVSLLSKNKKRKHSQKVEVKAVILNHGQEIITDDNQNKEEDNYSNKQDHDMTVKNDVKDDENNVVNNNQDHDSPHPNEDDDNVHDEEIGNNKNSINSTKIKCSTKTMQDDTIINGHGTHLYSSYVVSFNRRGTYLATGHATCTLPIYDFNSRTLSCIHHPLSDEYSNDDNNVSNTATNENVEYSNTTDNKLASSSNIKPYRYGVTSISWSRRSRILLAASINDANICFIDNTHPYGTLDTGLSQTNNTGTDDNTANATTHSNNNPSPKKGSSKSLKSINSSDLLQEDDDESMASVDEGESSLANKRSTNTTKTNTSSSSTCKPSNTNHVSLQRILHIPTIILPSSSTTESNPSAITGLNIETKLIKQDKEINRPNVTSWYQSIVLTLPLPVGGSVDIHPDGNSGLASLIDGSLVLFGIPHGAFQQFSTIIQEQGNDPQNNSIGKVVYIHKACKSQDDDDHTHYITNATYSKNGQTIYAITANAKILIFQIPAKLHHFLTSSSSSSITEDSSKSDDFNTLQQILASLQVHECDIPGGAKPTQIIKSRNDQYLLINSMDNILRLYSVDDIWNTIQGRTDACSNNNNDSTTNVSTNTTNSNTIIVKPKFTYQDLVSKVPFISCDFSGDAEYIVAGCHSKNLIGDVYELYIWNTATGFLIDQLTGPQVSLYDICWHPTRPFITVATSDGLVDIWGPRMDWTAFAPDFQALRRNVEYIEREDEFDEVVLGSDAEEKEEVERKELVDRMEQGAIDVVSKDSIPAYDSDSEDEANVFYFQMSFSGRNTSSSRNIAK